MATKEPLANPKADAMNEQFVALKDKIRTLETELTAERKKAALQAGELREMRKERDDALLLRDSKVWPAAVDFILKTAPWNAMKITYEGFPNLEVVQVEMKPVRWTFRQGDIGLVVEENEMTETKSVK